LQQERNLHRRHPGSKLEFIAVADARLDNDLLALSAAACTVMLFFMPCCAVAFSTAHVIIVIMIIFFIADSLIIGAG